MISCPTDLKTIRRNILRGLSLIQVAVKIESGRESELDDPGMKERYRSWDQALDEAYYDYLEPLPRKIRLALPFLYEQPAGLKSVLFKNNVGAGKCLLKLPAELSAVLITSLDPREHGSKFWVYDQKDLHICLSIPQLEPTWPDIDSHIDEAKKVLDKLKRSGVSEIVPTVEEIKGIIREVVGEYQRPWPIRADESDDPKHHAAKIIGDRRPWRGVPVSELRGFVFRMEPATREEAFRAASRLMLESGGLRIEHIEWTGHDGKKTEGECYILGVDPSPAGDDDSDGKKSGGKHAKDSDHRVNRDSRRNLLFTHLDKRGGHYDTLKTLRRNIEQETGLKEGYSESTLYNLLKGTKYARKHKQLGTPYRAASVPGKHTSETEAVADDSPLEMWETDPYHSDA